MDRLRTSSLLTLVVVMCLSHLASAADINPTGPTVALGSDYFTTQAGTHFNFGGPIGNISFTGLPVGPGSTDTIVQRQADAPIDGSTPIPIQLIALSLQSTAPVNVGGNFFNVFVTLDPSNLANDTGTMTISGNTTGGTFNSSFGVFFDAHFAPVGGGGATFDVFSNTILSQSGAQWSSTPPPNILLVTGVDDGSAADQAANSHLRLTCSPLNADCEVDFYVTGNLTQTDPNGNANVVAAAEIPEPASFALIGSGLLAGLLVRRRRK
jgi:PEP-CTERM motif